MSRDGASQSSMASGTSVASYLKRLAGRITITDKYGNIRGTFVGASEGP